ncbi:MAG: tRNA-dihydrouridine synthase, partial [Treponema sp.]|nr:tRNA-dihydrouridine synthase [Treponema sp.]
MPLYHPVKIGNLSLDGNLFLAPVAGYSDRAFRSICAECGADFAYTEMVSSEALTRNNEKTENLMARAPNEKAYAVQIFG